MRSEATPFGVIAHRGISKGEHGNTQRAFRRARELGVDAVELDVRLTKDREAAVHHDFMVSTDGLRPIFELDAADVRASSVGDGETVPMLDEVLEEFAGTIGLEIELKGPEPEAADVIAPLLLAQRRSWDQIEVTSFDGALLLAIARRCPGIATALLVPASEPWMTDDIVAYSSLHRARAAQATAVHLSAKQLTPRVAAFIRERGVEVHAHSVDDDAALRTAVECAIPWVCTNEPERALAFRRSLR